MPDRSLSRRQAIKLGAASVVPSLAGCLDDDRGRPWYAAWLPAGDGLAIAAVDLTRSADSEGDPSLLPAVVPGDDDPPTPGREFELDISGLGDVTDPLVTFPLEVGARRVGFSTLGLAVTDLFPVIGRPEEFASELRRLLVLNTTIVAAGTVDRAEIDRRLTGVPAPFAVAYERTGSVAGGYDRYEPTETPEEFDRVPTVAVSSEAVVVGFDGDRLRRVVETKAGDRRSANDDRLAWLLEQVGVGDVVAGTIGSPPAERLGAGTIDSPFVPADGEDVLAAVDTDSREGTLRARFALAADELAEDRRATVESELGAAASGGSVDTPEDRIVATGTYDATTIDVRISERTDEERLSRSQARELVPEGTLEAWYVPSLGDGYGTFWVDVTADTDAAAIRLETDTGGGNEVGPREGSVEAGLSVAAQVDPTGDEVTILAVDERERAGELTTLRVPTDELSREAAQRAVPPGALSFSYEPPGAGNLGELLVAVRADTGATVLVPRPREAPAGVADRAGSLGNETPVRAGTTLRTPVNPGGDEVVVFATVEGATGAVARWTGP